MNQDFSNLNNSDTNQSDNEALNNQDLSNNQTSSQQFNATQYQNTTGQNINFENSYQQPSNLGINSQNENNNSKKKSKVGLLIIIVVILLAIVIGVFILTNTSGTKNGSNESNNEANINTNDNKSSDAQLVIYLNNLKITLGKTTMDEIIKNTDLEVIKDETNKYEGSTSNNPSLSSEDWSYYDKRIIQLSDGINIFIIESYFEKTNIAGEISILRNGKTDDLAFDNSKGTTLSFEDAVIGKKINIGDMYTDFEYEVYNNSSVGSCNESGYFIYCYQSKHLSNDMFIYYLDDNQKVVNMTATLMSYYP